MQSTTRMGMQALKAGPRAFSAVAAVPITSIRGARPCRALPGIREAGVKPSVALPFAGRDFAPVVRRRGLSVRVTASAGNGSGTYDYDLFTIGGGSGGVRASRFASGNYGAKVALCEMPLDWIASDTAGGVGGTCVLRGCVPKKLMVYASQYAEEFRGSVGYGWADQALPAHDWSKFMEAKRKELTRLNGAYGNTLKNAKVDLIQGRGRIVDAHTVEVDGKTYTAKHILIATGGRSWHPNIPGAELCIDSDRALELPACPKKITIIGGGYIGVEFAGIFKRFGTEVHVVVRQSLPLGGFDMEVRKFAAEQYKASGLHIHQHSKPTEVKRQPDGKLTINILDDDGSHLEIKDNDHVFFATGRVPNTKNLGLEAAGVKLGARGEIVVDEYSRTSVPSIHAIGDVTNRVNLTPVALMEGMALAKTLFANQPTKPDYHAIPSAVFSNPEIATVGLTEEAAIEKYTDVDVYTTSFRPMRNTVSGSPLRTFMKIVVDAKTDVVVGCHMVGDHAAEIMQGFAVAVKVGVTKAQIDSVVGIHPSAAEEFVTMRSATRSIRAQHTVPAATH